MNLHATDFTSRPTNVLKLLIYAQRLWLKRLISSQVAMFIQSEIKTQGKTMRLKCSSDLYSHLIPTTWLSREVASNEPHPQWIPGVVVVGGGSPFVSSHWRIKRTNRSLWCPCRDFEPISQRTFPLSRPQLRKLPNSLGRSVDPLLNCPSVHPSACSATEPVAAAALGWKQAIKVFLCREDSLMNPVGAVVRNRKQERKKKKQSSLRQRRTERAPPRVSEA